MTVVDRGLPGEWRLLETWHIISCLQSRKKLQCGAMVQDSLTAESCLEGPGAKQSM